MSGGWSTQPLVSDQMAHPDDLPTPRSTIGWVVTTRNTGSVASGSICRMETRLAKLRQQSIIILAHARQMHADAEAARLRAVKSSSKAYTAALSAVARRLAAKAATRRNTERQQ